MVSHDSGVVSQPSTVVEPSAGSVGQEKGGPQPADLVSEDPVLEGSGVGGDSLGAQVGPVGVPSSDETSQLAINNAFTQKPPLHVQGSCPATPPFFNPYNSMGELKVSGHPPLAGSVAEMPAADGDSAGEEEDGSAGSDEDGWEGGLSDTSQLYDITASQRGKLYSLKEISDFLERTKACFSIHFEMPNSGLKIRRRLPLQCQDNCLFSLTEPKQGKFARQFSQDEPLTFDWVCRHVHWPLVAPRNIKDLVHLEAVHLTLDLYLWLSYRFMDMFPDANLIRDIQKELDNIIQLGVRNTTRLIRASETNSSSLTGTDAIPDDDIPLHRIFPKDRGLNTEDLSEARQQKQ
ncbi:UNVERIFIED_CONTAM: hypothetical protein FKN15_022484 [Acipenser sinensis]